eukprot:m.7005 g.7005  ORF g.7005 m.7005 type:complete len:506 (+) comp5634_c0_seq1:128-1645(+)
MRGELGFYFPFLVKQKNTLFLVRLLELCGLDWDILNASNHIECLFWVLVILTLQDIAESLDGVAHFNKGALHSSERLCDSKRLGEESLNLTGTSNNHLISLGQLIHTKDSNDILKTLVVLENLLHVTSAVIVFITNNSLVKDTGGGIKRIHGRVDTQLGNTTRKHSGGVKMGKRGGRGRIGQIISWHVHGLHRGNGSKSSGGNALLHGTHISGEGWLVTDSGRNTTKKGRHLRTGLCEAENVVNKEEHIASTSSIRIGKITERFSNSQTSEGNTGTCTWGLVHLTVHKGHLGVITFKINHTTFNHLMVQIVTLTGALTNTSKHRETRVLLCNIVDQFHNKHSLSDTSTSKESNLSTLCVWGKKVNDLNTSFKNSSCGLHFSQNRGFSVNRHKRVSLNGTTLINWLSNNIHNTTKGSSSNGNCDGSASIRHSLSTNKTFCTIHSNCTHCVFTQMLSNFKNKSLFVIVDFEGIEDRWQVRVEFHINNGTNNRHNGTICLGSQCTGCH